MGLSASKNTLDVSQLDCSPEEVARWDALFSTAATDGKVTEQAFMRLLDIDRAFAALPEVVVSRIFHGFTATRTVKPATASTSTTDSRTRQKKKHKKDRSFITRQEFLEGMTVLVHGSTEQRLRLLFDMYDHSESGVLSKHDMKGLLTSILDGTKSSEELDQLLLDLFEAADKDEDGRLDFAEFSSIADMEGYGDSVIKWLFQFLASSSTTMNLETETNNLNNTLTVKEYKNSSGGGSVWLNRRTSVVSVTHFRGQEVTTLEKYYHGLAIESKTRTVTTGTLVHAMADKVQLPVQLTEKLIMAFVYTRRQQQQQQQSEPQPEEELQMPAVTEVSPLDDDDSDDESDVPPNEEPPQEEEQQPEAQEQQQEYLKVDETADFPVSITEFVCGMSVLCRGSASEKFELLFKAFDSDQSEALTADNIKDLIDLLLLTGDISDIAPLAQSLPPLTPVKGKAPSKFTDSTDSTESKETTASTAASAAAPKQASEALYDSICTHLLSGAREVSLQPFVKWGLENDIGLSFCPPLAEFVAVYCGLRPAKRSEEVRLINAFAQDNNNNNKNTTHRYLVSSRWFRAWASYIASPEIVSPASEPAATTTGGLSTVDLSNTTGAITAAPPIMDNDIGLTESGVYEKHLETVKTTNSTIAPFASPRAKAMKKRHKLLALSTPSQPKELIPTPASTSKTSNGFLDFFSPKKRKQKKKLAAALASKNSGVELGSVSVDEATTENKRYHSPQIGEHPGEIDNTDLVLERVPPGYPDHVLRENLQKGDDYMILEERVWKALSTWYGGGPAIPRQMVPADVSDQQTTTTAPAAAAAAAAANILELYPLLLECTSSHDPLMRVLMFNRRSTVAQLEVQMREMYNIEGDEIVTRIWDTFEAKPLLLSDPDVLLGDADIVSNQSLYLEVQLTNGRWIGPPGGAPTGVDGKTDGPDVDMDSHQQGFVDSNYHSGGLSGLYNLGNTCYMNSALQAMSHTWPLAQYFLSDTYLGEINENSRDGSAGKLAIVFGVTLQKLWSNDDYSALAPRKLKWTIGKVAERFVGTRQHDAQELLAVLLDGLHEDLNRITDKPYIQYKDHNGRSDLLVADEYWGHYVARESSVIVDLFSAQIRSTITHPCGYKSVTFDPYRFLSMPLPKQKETFLEFVVVFHESSRTPIRYSLSVSKGMTRVKHAKEVLSAMCGVATDRMQMVQIYHNSVSDFLVNENALNSIASQDITYVYVAPPRGELETPMTDEQRAEIAAAEAAAEAKRQEEETTIYVGDRFDVLDTVAAWRVAQITKMHKTVKRSTHRAHSDDPDQRERVVTRTEVKLLFNYVGWPSKWDEWILLGSKRIEPLHTYTKGKSTTRHYNRKVELDVPLETTINLHLRHRLLKPVQEYFLHPFEPEVFHTPMLVFVNKDTTTCADLYQLVWKRAGLYTAVPERAGLTGLFAEEDKNSSSSSAAADEKASPFPPFLLKTVKRKAKVCSQCSWVQSCLGCVLPFEDSALPAAALKDDATIAIDWNPVFFETYLNQKELKAIINDKTTVAHRAISTRSVSIGDCMSIFTAPETLEKDSTPRCPVCKDWHSSGVIKSLDLWSTPPVLMLHFKRLMMNQKLYTMVAAPVTGFDPGPYLAPRDSEFDVDASEAAEIARYEKDVADLEDAKMKPEERASKLEKLHKQADARVKERVEERARLKVLQEKEQATNGERPLYDLYAVVNHHGGARSGHYIAYAKSRRDGLWYSFNDRMVTQVHENAVVTESAYLLMYEQRGFGNKYMSDLRELKKSGVISEHVEKEKQKALQQITKRDCLNGCTWSGCFGFCPGTCCGEDDDEDELSGAEEQDVELELDDNTDAETPGSKTRPHGVRVAPAESIVSEEET